jgi:hypothetical protein
MPIDSSLIPTGEASWFTVASGTVTLVSCGAPLLYRTDRAATTDSELPAGTGMEIDSSLADGVLVKLSQDGVVSIVAEDGAEVHIDLDVLVRTGSDGVCTTSVCWTMSNSEPGEDGDISPLCGWYRCP